MILFHTIIRMIEKTAELGLFATTGIMCGVGVVMVRLSLLLVRLYFACPESLSNKTYLYQLFQFLLPPVPGVPGACYPLVMLLAFDIQHDAH